MITSWSIVTLIGHSATFEQYFTRSVSSANDKPACPHSCAACNPNSDVTSAARSGAGRRRSGGAGWREEALPRAAPLAAPVASIRRGRCLAEWDRFLDADDVIARRRDLHVRVGELEAIT